VPIVSQTKKKKYIHCVREIQSVYRVGYGLDGRGFGAGTRVRDFSLLHEVHTVSGAYPFLPGAVPPG
jgi:hypothetical protein